MNINTLKEQIKEVDIYVLDQILKGIYTIGNSILDVGCGRGRNLRWFYKAGFEIHGIDLNVDDIAYCKQRYKKQQVHFATGSLEQLPYNANSFDHVICVAVLHFAENLNDYLKMFNELLRVLKPQGTLVIRTAASFGIENLIEPIGNGVYKLPDGSTRFLLNTEILDTIREKKNMFVVEDVKTTIVENKRAMTTLMIKKGEEPI